MEEIIEDIFGENLHQKKQQSLAYAAMGLLTSESLFLHEMGEGLARSLGKNKKHATKQIDRLLSNQGVSVWDLSPSWVAYVIGAQTQLMVVLDWTSFAGDKQWMVSLNILKAKGVSTPLLWQTVDEKRLKHNRARYEDQLLSRLKTAIPAHIQVTLVADRGFADQKFFRFLSEELQFHYIIRIKANTIITYQGALLRGVQDEDWNVREAALSALGKLSFSDERIISALLCGVQDEDWNVRRVALNVLENVSSSDERVISALLLGVQDKDVYVRRIIRQSLSLPALCQYYPHRFVQPSFMREVLNTQLLEGLTAVVPLGKDPGTQTFHYRLWLNKQPLDKPCSHSNQFRKDLKAIRWIPMVLPPKKKLGQAVTELFKFKRQSTSADISSLKNKTDEKPNP